MASYEDTRDGMASVTEYIQTTDEDTLLNNEKSATEVFCRIRKPKRKIIIEPLLLIMCLFSFPLFLLNSLYVNHRFQELVVNEHNLTFLNLTESHCDDDNSTLPIYKEAQAEVQRKNALFNILSSICSTVPCLITTVFLGAYSDKAGRKYAIILPCLFYLFSSIIYVLVCITNAPVWCLLIGSFIEGIGGSYEMMLAGCFAYIADTVEPNDRMFRITFIELFNFMLGSFGPLAIGQLLQRGVPYIYPMIVCCFGIVLANLYAIFLIPETIIPESGNIKLFSLGHLQTTIHTFTLEPHVSELKEDNNGPAIFRRRWKLATLLLSFALFTTVVLGFLSFDTLYQLNKPLCWTQAHIGDFTAVTLSVGTVLGLTLARLLKCVLNDPQITLVSSVSGTAHYLFMAFVVNSAMMYVAQVMGVAERLLVPAVRATMSGLVLPTEQGSVFSAIAITEVLCSFVGSTGLNALYGKFAPVNPGIVFFVMTAFLLATTCLMLFYNIRCSREKHATSFLNDHSH